MSSYTFQVLSSVTATGSGSPLTFDAPRSYYASLQVSYTGSPSDVHVHLEGTVDGTNWNNIMDFPFQTNGTIQSASIFPVIGLRANLIALSGGSSPTVSATLVVVTDKS